MEKLSERRVFSFV